MIPGKNGEGTPRNLRCCEEEGEKEGEEAEAAEEAEEETQSGVSFFAPEALLSCFVLCL